MSNWISVEDELPEAHLNVLTINEDDYQEVAILYPDGVINTYTWRRTGLEILEYMPTHWMPLPEPPKLREDEDE